MSHSDLTKQIINDSSGVVISPFKVKHVNVQSAKVLTHSTESLSTSRSRTRCMTCTHRQVIVHVCPDSCTVCSEAFEVI